MSRPSTFSVSALTWSGIFSRCGLTASALRIGLERTLLVADLLHDHAEPCQRAEMTGLPDQHLADVGERAGIVVLHVVERGAPVPGLDVVGPELDDRIQQLDRDVDLLAHRPRSWPAPSTALRCRSGSGSRSPRSAPRHAWRWPRRARPSARRTGNRDSCVRSALGSLAGGSGSFFCCLAGGAGSSCASAGARPAPLREPGPDTGCARKGISLPWRKV